MTVLEVLIKARGRIDKPQKWCAHWSASDDGRRLGADGALWWAVDDWNPDAFPKPNSLVSQALHVLAETSGINPQWTDSERVTYLTFHKEVMAMFDKAIAKLKEEKERGYERRTVERADSQLSERTIYRHAGFT